MCAAFARMAGVARALIEYRSQTRFDIECLGEGFISIEVSLKLDRGQSFHRCIENCIIFGCLGE